MTTMSKPYMRLQFLLLLLLFCVSPSVFLILSASIVGLVRCHPHQIQALTQFKNEFDSRSCNQTAYFNGVWCDNSTGVVTKLQVPSGCLTGILKPNSILFQLHQLRYLDLSDNNFTSSSIPSELGNLNNLEVLSLSFSGFLGQVPLSFSNLSLLSFLDLSNNELTGRFPLVWNLSKLTILDLSQNHFFGTLDPSCGLFQLHQLRYLSLGFNNFTSSLPSLFSNLNKLEVFSLSSNGFFGQVPPTVSNLTCLTELYLAHNRLTGDFPLVQNLTRLSILQLYDNHFSGTIPSSLLVMPLLSFIDLRENNLVGSIEVPNSSTSSRLESMYLGHNLLEVKTLESISNLIKLKHLDLSSLNTRNPIDLSVFSSLKSLLYLDLSDNSISPASLMSDSDIPLNLESLALSGCGMKEFPNILKTLQKLEFIDISRNRIQGKIYEWLWSLPRLITVDITNNFFNGFEGSMKVLVNSSVQVLALDSNRFEGSLPHLPLSINVFSARNNSFRGDIPLSICNRSSLDVLDLCYNNFTGTIPQCLSNFTFVDLRKNNLEGSIPDNFYASSSLRTLDIGYNRLTGKLPRSFLNCSSLQFLNVENNKIEDTFPFLLKGLPNLQVLILRSNKLHGPISPPHQGPLGFPELRIFEISDNIFTGSLSPNFFVNWKASSLTMNENGGLYMEYEKNNYGLVYYTYIDDLDLQYKGLFMEQEKVLTSYATIDFSGNRLEGQIPEFIGLLKALIALNLSNNAFTCHIPLSLASLTKLESLDLSSNQLSGTIPMGIEALSFLAYVNVSHNQLHGEIPQGTQITGQQKSSFEGNAGLCGLPLEEGCFGTIAPPIQQPDEEKEEKEDILNWKAVAIGYGFGILLGLAIEKIIASFFFGRSTNHIKLNQIIAS